MGRELMCRGDPVPHSTKHDECFRRLPEAVLADLDVRHHRISDAEIGSQRRCDGELEAPGSPGLEHCRAHRGHRFPTARGHEADTSIGSMVMVILELDAKLDGPPRRAACLVWPNARDIRIEAEPDLVGKRGQGPPPLLELAAPAVDRVEVARE